MEISDQQLQEFMRLYREHFGKDIDRGDAIVQAEKLLRLVALLRQRHRARKSAPSSRP